jgi:multicomponent Na+:H+ antiporter subunit D
MRPWTHPAAIFILGAVIIPLLRGRLRQAYMLALTAAAFAGLLHAAEGASMTYGFMGHDVVFARADRLSLAFGYVFVVMTFIGVVYSAHVKDAGENAASFIYAGGALGAVFSGDYLTLFMFWEVMAAASAYLVWNGKTPEAGRAGLRYVMVHLFGGLLLLSGIVMKAHSAGSLAFVHAGALDAASCLILAGFLVNAAAPPLHAWLPDAYPESTVTGAVFMSAFTTKTAVYAIVRGFSGAAPLVWVGVAMAVYGVVYAFLSDDYRRLLSYHIISQVGFMVAGAGIGTALAVNGAVAHAFTNIFAKGLLFMAAGAVLNATGRRGLTGLGGLYRAMPITLVMYAAGALSISGWPLFAGFASKSLVLSAAGAGRWGAAFLVLTFASAGTFLSIGLKLTRHIFFGEDAGIEAKEPPVNMLVAMGMAAALCLAAGVYPGLLYGILPHAVEYAPYAMAHVTGVLLLLISTGLGYLALIRRARAEAGTTIDLDWFYRRGASALQRTLDGPLCEAASGVKAFSGCVISSLVWFGRNPLSALKIALDTTIERFSHSSRAFGIRNRVDYERAAYPGDTLRHWPIGSTVLWVTLFLLAYLFAHYL